VSSCLSQQWAHSAPVSTALGDTLHTDLEYGLFHIDNAFKSNPLLIFILVAWQRCPVLNSKTNAAKTLTNILQGNIWSVCQLKFQCFASVKKTTLVTAVFWLLWLTYKSLCLQGLTGCSLTLSSHYLLYRFAFVILLLVTLCSCVFARGSKQEHTEWFSRPTWISPWHLKNSQKWSRQTGRCGLGRAAQLPPLDRTASSLVHQTVSTGLKSEEKDGELAVSSVGCDCCIFLSITERLNVQAEKALGNAPEALHRTRAVQLRKPSPRRSVYISQTPPWTSTADGKNRKRATEKNKDIEVDNRLIIHYIWMLFRYRILIQ